MFEIECAEIEVEPTMVWLTALPLPDKYDWENIEEHNLFWSPCIKIGGYELLDYTVDITYQDKTGSVTQRRVTINDYYSDTDAIRVHCHLRSESRRLFVTGIREMKFVSHEYQDNPGIFPRADMHRYVLP
jgi:hypothetical protein